MVKYVFLINHNITYTLINYECMPRLEIKCAHCDKIPANLIEGKTNRHMNTRQIFQGIIRDKVFRGKGTTSSHRIQI